MTTEPQRGLTYKDLQEFPDDNLRRELIDGELIVTAAPATRHQRAVVSIASALLSYARVSGGQAYPAPTDVYLSDVDVVEPDVIFVAAGNLDRIETRFINGPPDVVVEVSSPTTRRLELRRKLDLYQRYRIPEYWYVDLDAERVELYVLQDDAYGLPALLGPAETLVSSRLPGFSMPVAEALPD